MRCAACGAANDYGRTYCGDCAHSLGETCAVCQFLNGEGVRYCGGCARDLLAVVAAPPAAAVPVPAPGAVRTSPNQTPVVVFDNLEDLLSGVDPAAADKSPELVATDATQDEIDGFFRRLVRQGDAEINAPGASTAPSGLPRSVPP